MTDPTYTHLTCVVDRSGSMFDVREDAEGGLNALLAEQFSADGKFTVTVVEFDDQVGDVVRMSSEPFTYKLAPRAATALLDAVGSELARTGEDLSALDEDDRPGTVLFVIITDGYENASKEYTLEAVRAKLAEQRDTYSWAVQFIGADDAAWAGSSLGAAVTSYAGTRTGTRSAYAALSQAVTSARMPGAVFEMPDRIDENPDGQ